MKNSILILFILVITGFNSIAQSNFEIGFKKGFANGYCYTNDRNAGYYCTPPLPPLTPLPQLNESYDNFQDGYNRGFLYGQVRRREVESKSSSGSVYAPNPPKFNPYINQNPIINLTPEEREAYYAAKAHQDQETAAAIAYLLESVLTRTPEQKAAHAAAKRQREQARWERQDERKKKRELNRLIVGSSDYYKCKTSKNIWLGTTLVAGAAGAFSYFQANKYMSEYPSATNDAASVAQKANTYNVVYPICFAVAGCSSIVFLSKTIKIGKAKTQPVSFYPIPVKAGLGLHLSYNF